MFMDEQIYECSRKQTVHQTESSAGEERSIYIYIYVSNLKQTNDILPHIPLTPKQMIQSNQ